jgi:hypothetical protein
MQPKVKKTGRPGYDKSIRQKLLKAISEGKSLRKACEGKGMPVTSTVMKWLAEDAEFSEQYARACDERALFHFEECLEIADATNADDVAKAKLRIDTRKWMVGKMAPKKYGDRQTVEHEGGVTVTKIERAFVDTETPKR